MTDPGVPTGDNPRWTVDGDYLRFGHDVAIIPKGSAGIGVLVGLDVPTAAMNVTAHDALVRAVRDAAQVPALQATARRWQELAEDAIAYIDTFKHTRPDRGAVASQFGKRADALLDLLTEAPDGEV